MRGAESKAPGEPQAAAAARGKQRNPGAGAWGEQAGRGARYPAAYRSGGVGSLHQPSPAAQSQAARAVYCRQAGPGAAGRHGSVTWAQAGPSPSAAQPPAAPTFAPAPRAIHTPLIMPPLTLNSMLFPPRLTCGLLKASGVGGGEEGDNDYRPHAAEDETSRSDRGFGVCIELNRLDPPAPGAAVGAGAGRHAVTSVLPRHSPPSPQDYTMCGGTE